jgi:acyl carrier protein
MTRAGFVSAAEEVLGVAPGSLRESDTRDTVEGWSSLEDLKLMTLISSECGVEADGELLQIETIGELLAKLEQLNAFSN